MNCVTKMRHTNCRETLRATKNRKLCSQIRPGPWAHYMEVNGYCMRVSLILKRAAVVVVLSSCASSRLIVLVFTIVRRNGSCGILFIKCLCRHLCVRMFVVVEFRCLLHGEKLKTIRRRWRQRRRRCVRITRIPTSNTIFPLAI